MKKPITNHCEPPTGKPRCYRTDGWDICPECGGPIRGTQHIDLMTTDPPTCGACCRYCRNFRKVAA